MKNWYIVQTFSGFEQKVAETLKDTIKKRELENQIEDVLVPVHEVTEVKRGKSFEFTVFIFWTMFTFVGGFLYPFICSVVKVFLQLSKLDF